MTKQCDKIVVGRAHYGGIPCWGWYFRVGRKWPECASIPYKTAKAAEKVARAHAAKFIVPPDVIVEDNE